MRTQSGVKASGSKPAQLTARPGRTRHTPTSNSANPGRNFGLWFALVLSSLLLAGCNKPDDKKEKPAEATAEKPGAEPESRVKHGTNGEVSVTVETKLQQTIGLQVAPLESAQLNPEVKGYGHVVDPSGLASLVADLVTVEAAGQASEAELNRLKTLAAQSNASERAVQAAQAAAVHDQAQIQSIRLRLLAGWGKGISERNDLPQFVQSLGSLSSALVQLEIPAGDTISSAPVGARLFALADETKPVPAQIIGPAPSVDPQMQGRGFLLLVEHNPGALISGAAVTGYLTLPGFARSGILLPRSAVVRFNGETWIYVQTADDTFRRQSVALEAPLENGWFVGAGLKPQDKVVTVGGQQLLSEELKGQIGTD